MNKINDISSTSLPARQGGSPVANRFVFVAKVALLFLAAAYIAHQTGVYNQVRDWLKRRGFFPQNNGSQIPGRNINRTNTSSSSSQSVSSSIPSQLPKPKISPNPWPDTAFAKRCTEQILECLTDVSKLQHGEDGIPLLNETRSFLQLVQSESIPDLTGGIKRSFAVETLSDPNQWLDFRIKIPGDFFRAAVIKPVSLKLETVEVGGQVVQLASCEGRESVMNDRHISETIRVTGYPEMPLIGIFGGYHDSSGFYAPGDIVAEFIQTNIVEYFTKELISLLSEGDSNIVGDLLYARIIYALKNSIIKIDEAYLRCGRWQGDNHESFAAPANGSTVVIAVVVHGHIIIAQLGDSSAILVRDGSPIPLSIRATFTNERYRSKIIALGGRTLLSEQSDSYARSISCNILCLTKPAAVGDHRIRPNRVRKCVINDPEMTITQFSPGNQLVMGSPGVWPVVSFNRAASIVSRTSEELEGTVIPDSVNSASLLANLALRTTGQNKNVTVAVVSL